MVSMVVLALWFGVLLVRLFDLQVRRHQSYSQRAEHQQQQAVKLDPPRGTIFDARARELAVSVEVRSVAADPTAIADPSATANPLAEVLGLDAERLAEDLASDRAFVWVRRKLDPPQVERVRALGLRGVFTLPESKRYYPMGSLAAQVLGYVGTDNTGLAGLEFRYQSVVASTPGRRVVVRDARFDTALLPALERAEATPGQDLHLTLDAAIQHLAERELAAAVDGSGARGGTVVVMDPRTGAVLAMASYPTFDPNRFAASPPSHWRNRAVMDAYEPGSTFKMVTLAAALEANVVDPLEKIDCEMGGITLRGVRIKDHRPFGALTTREIIARSSNVGAIKLGFAAGRQRLHATIEKFGFGRPTGIDLPSESAGILRPLERWTELQPAYVAFGQSLSVTALQLTRAFAAIANGGYLLRPYVVARPVPEGGERRQVVGMPIAPSSVIQVRSMLESVVLAGTGKAAAVPHYRVAGKTGTAEKAYPGRGYVDGKYVASFVGFAPVDRPAVVCTVVLDEPWPAYHGGQVAAPVFSAIVGKTLLYLGIPPDGEGYESPLAEAPGPLLAAVTGRAAAASEAM
jgi:cell division protein FtsI (penicillin-binding protein 3)